ncbi:SpoIIE family protein phosphatase [Kitasatospora indigofera]|uniref:ATP-binding SpoIIE family protein phosphatase n=1 Tax=Kitasatospora indigofera TaxID=67307 RepID=UPI0036A9B995
MNRPETAPATGAEIVAAAVDEHGLVTAWSHGAFLLLGYRAAEAVGRRAAEFLAQPLPPSLRHRLARQETWAVPVGLRARDGRRVEVQLRGCPLADARGHGWWHVEAATPDQAAHASLSLQRSLLQHRPPARLAVETASRYLPADPAAGVGGDWFDVVPLSGARIALVVGDVVGHGIRASATMGRLRMAVRTLADVDLPPDELLTQLDDLILAEIEEGFESPAEIGATCLYAVYDPVTRQLALASAGHPAPLLVTPDATIRTVDLVPGPPLGVGGVPFEATGLHLPEGSLLVLYTDGLIETRRRSIDTGLSMLTDELANPGPSLEETCDRLVDALLPHHPEDDAALLVARTHALAPSNVVSRELPADPAVVAEARRWAVDQLGRWNLADTAFTTELVVSELLTNAIRYARPPLELRLIHNAGLICEVSDGSSTSPHPHRARALDEGGRGLFMVGQLTSRWGTRHTRTGKTVWAEQPIRRPVHAAGATGGRAG